jgi:hypothetical protein
MTLRESLVLTVPGLIVGMILALTFARLIKTFVYHVPPADPILVAVATICLIAVATISAWLPARPRRWHRRRLSVTSRMKFRKQRSRTLAYRNASFETLLSRGETGNPVRFVGYSEVTHLDGWSF